MTILKCSSCGALLEPNSEKKIATCPYCGTSHIITDEINTDSNKTVSSQEGTIGENRYSEEGRRAAEASRKLKKKIIIALVAMVVFAAVAMPLISFLDGEKTDNEPYAPPKPPSSVIWYEPDYDRLIDIRKDPAYLELDREIRVKSGEMTKALNPDRLSSESPAVQVLYELVQALIDGDADAYNALFSERYAADPHVPELEAPFTMQRVYNILITEVEERSASDENGEYTEYLYQLEYMINRNDGTYRTDIGHDASRPQYFQLTDREGEVLIDALRYFE